jgi:voltage-gated sodium channel
MSAQELVKFHPYPRIRRIVINRYFENAMTLLIIANCVIIGWQAGLPAEPEGTVKLINTIIEQSFTCFFFSELVLRAIAFNWTFFFDNENHLDIFLVTLSVLNTWMLAPMNIKADFLRKASVLRILRLVRVAKAYKTRFKEMWQLLRGIVDSLETLIWTYVMMGCVLYFFGITATIIFTKMGFFDDDEVAKDITVANFNDVLKSMFTLYQFMTLDSWTAISRPLADVHWWSDIFFFIFISVSVFVLMNLITAVIVDKAELAAKDDKAEVLAEKERQKEEAMKELTEIFKDIDEDNSGMIDREELLRARKRQKVRAKFRMMEIGKKDLDQLWDALCGGKQKDKRTGQPKIQEVRINDLVECIQRLKGEAKAKDILKLYREVRILEESIREMEALSDYFQKTARNTKSKLYTTFREMDAVRRTLQRVKDMSRLAVKSQCMSEGFVETSED